MRKTTRLRGVGDKYRETWFAFLPVTIVYRSEDGFGFNEFAETRWFERVTVEYEVQYDHGMHLKLDVPVRFID